MNTQGPCSYPGCTAIISQRFIFCSDHSGASPSQARADFEAELELQMNSMLRQTEQLIEMHDRYGTTMQKTYLYRVKGALFDGLEWFRWNKGASST